MTSLHNKAGGRAMLALQKPKQADDNMNYAQDEKVKISRRSKQKILRLGFLMLVAMYPMLVMEQVLGESTTTVHGGEVCLDKSEGGEEESEPDQAPSSPSLPLFAETKNSTKVSVSEDNDEIGEDLVEWIRANGGTVDDRQVIRRERPGDPLSRHGVFATADIPEGEVLCRIPWEIVLSPGGDGSMCETIRATRRELKLGVEASSFGPYLQLLRRNPVMMPNAWSDAGKFMLASVVGDNLSPKDVNRHLEWWESECGGGGMESDPEGANATLLMVRHAPGVWVPSGSEGTLEDELQRVMVPFYDSYNHRNGAWYNTRVNDAVVGEDFTVIASRDIVAGEQIYNSYGHGNPLGTAEMLRDYGFVEEMPQRWSFNLVDDAGETHLVEFDLDEANDSASLKDLKVVWVNGAPPSSKALHMLRDELERLETIPRDPANATKWQVPEHEKALIRQYHSAMVVAIQQAIAAASASTLDESTMQDTSTQVGVSEGGSELRSPSKVWAKTKQTLSHFYAAGGVNLALYPQTGEESEAEEAKQDAEPFELYDTFNIEAQITGDENWADLKNYRRNLQLSQTIYYMDKVTLKRWLSSIGISVPPLFALKHASELSESGELEDDKTAILSLLPKDSHYVAKPTHKAESTDVWIIKNTNNGTALVSENVGTFREEEHFDHEVVANSLAKALHERPDDSESWSLLHVKPGIVVEALISSWDRGNTEWDTDDQPAALEFKFFVIWGRVWIAQMFQGGNWHGVFNPGFVHRNGTMVKGSFKESIPDWLDWSHMVEVAERVGAHIDMLRVDIFPGVPAGSPSLRDGATKEEQLAAVQYYVSEVGMKPDTELNEELMEEGARLWVAGYKMGNYRIVPNKEFPEEYDYKTSSLSAPSGVDAMRYYENPAIYADEAPVQEFAVEYDYETGSLSSPPGIDAVSNYHMEESTGSAEHAPKVWHRNQYTLSCFEVAGVNLAVYGMDEENQTQVGQHVEPFELYEDFDISHFIQGHESFLDIIREYKMTSEWPSLLFYDDKVALKRWLPSVGFEIPRTFVLNYASELTSSGDDLEDEKNVILKLLPKDRGYVAKPSHKLRSDGVWIVDHDADKAVAFDGAGSFFEQQEYNHKQVADSLAGHLHEQLLDSDSNLQRAVKPGIVVEEHFKSFDTDEEPATEFKCFTFWGRMWIGAWRRGWKGEWDPGLVYRNGTMVEGSAMASLPDWVDWSRVVDIAERMGAHKDFARTDIFVGVPAGSPALRTGASESERHAAVKYVISEVSSTSSEHIPPIVLEEGLRLWIAGYKLGNYRVVPNTEVPPEFLL